MIVEYGLEVKDGNPRAIKCRTFASESFCSLAVGFCSVTSLNGAPIYVADDGRGGASAGGPSRKRKGEDGEEDYQVKRVWVLSV